MSDDRQTPTVSRSEFYTMFGSVWIYLGVLINLTDLATGPKYLFLAGAIGMLALASWRSYHSGTAKTNDKGSPNKPL
jgi:hypothetical protein